MHIYCNRTGKESGRDAAMKWTAFRIKTLTEAEDILISTLYEIGLEGAQIEDKVPLTASDKERMFVDILPETAEDDGIAYVTFFVETDEEGMLLLSGEKTTRQELLKRIEQEMEALRAFLELGEGTISLSETEDIDWINNWKQYFHQFYIDDLLVIPSWEAVEPKDKDRKVLHIDPGTAFGTGMHETTQLCIRQIRKYLTQETMLLDIGTGSGILGIISLMYGARHVTGTDIDPCAEGAVAENLAANGIDASRFQLLIGNLITEETLRERVGYEQYDIVTANILADVLVPLTPVAVCHMKPGGYYITSGIINENHKEQDVRDAMTAAGLEIVEVTCQGEWVSVTGRKSEKIV